MDFFDPTDRRYEYRMKEERKKTAARRSFRNCGIAIFRFWIRTLRGLRYPGIGSLSEYEPILKIFAIYVKFSAVQSITTSRTPGSAVFIIREDRDSAPCLPFGTTRLQYVYRIFFCDSKNERRPAMRRNCFFHNIIQTAMPIVDLGATDDGMKLRIPAGNIFPKISHLLCF